MNFLKLYVRFTKKDFDKEFINTVEELTDKPQKTMGIEEFVLARERRIGKIEGEIETSQEKDLIFVKSLLEKTSHSDEQIVDIAGVTLEFVQSVKRQLKK
jgi:hypothetical protein